MRSNPSLSQRKKRISGFTLVELIAGIVVLSVAFAVLTSFIYPLSNQSAEQVHQIRAAELGQSMINEILGKAFDENSDMSGGLVRCGEFGRDCSELLRPEETSRELYDDVDDYHGLSAIQSSLGASDDLGDIYQGFIVNVTVMNDSNYDGKTDGLDNNFTAKLITVKVTTPQDFTFTFAVYKMNF